MGDRIVVMKEGIVQQFDTPQVLYDTPDNLFVAGFIGSPQMNFMDVHGGQSRLCPLCGDLSRKKYFYTHSYEDKGHSSGIPSLYLGGE